MSSAETAPEEITATPAPPGFLDAVYGVIFLPAVTFRTLAQHRPAVWRSLLMITLTCLIQSTISILRSAGTGKLASHTGLTVVIGLTGVAVGIAAGFFGAAALHLFAELFGGRGSAVMLFSLVGMCQVPLLLTGVAALIPQGLIGDLATFGLGLWATALLIIAVRESEGLSTGRAIAAYFTPVVVFVVAALLFVFTLGYVAFRFLGNLPGFDSFMPT
ncbi:MAG: Yip1 family protein [Ignavibacteriales bacterium]